MIENIELPELPEASETGKSIVTKRDLSLCGHVTAVAEVVVGTVDITIENLFRLKTGDVVISNNSVDETMSLILNGKTIAKGNLVVVDDKFGFEITEVGE